MSEGARIYDSVAGACGVSALQGIAQASPDLYQTWPWFENLEAHGLPLEMRPLCVAAGDAGGGLLAWPLALHRHGPAAVYGPVVGALSTYYSSLYGPVGAVGDCSVQACRDALRALRSLGGAADVLDLQPLDREAPWFSAMISALAAEGYVSDPYFCFGNWHLPCAGLSFQAYHAELPSRVRNTIQRHRKKLDKNGPWSIELHREPGAAMEQAIDGFVQVYKRSWKVPEPFPGFVPGLCRMAAREGWLRLGLLKVGGAPAAAQLWLVRDGKAMIYKLAYDQAYSTFSPGSVLSAEIFRSMLDDEHVVDIDYLTGDDRYKQDWMRQRRERYGIVAFRRNSLRGLLSLAKHRLGQWRRAYRSRRAPPPGPDAQPSDT
jgi:CelD/BcsL family acetyltransferase involved in cellulose biosynthesis